MKLPLSKEELRSLIVVYNFNQAHGTNLQSWAEYYEELGITRSDAMDGDLEYSHYLTWLAIKDSPSIKPLNN